MNRLMLFLILLVSYMPCNAQNKAIRPDEALFEKAYALHELVYELELEATAEDTTKRPAVAEYAQGIRNEILDRALDLYTNLIDSFPRSELLFRTLNNRGEIELSLDDTDAAVQTYTRLLNSKADDGEAGGRGEGLMRDPYTNYKNFAAKALAGIEMGRKNYGRALHYFGLTKRYPYKHFCGNAHASERIYIAIQRARCHIGLKNYEAAYAVLIPEILENGLADNRGLVDLALDALLKKYTLPELRLSFEKAFSDVRTRTLTQGKETYVQPYVLFLGVRMELKSLRSVMAEIMEEPFPVEKFYENSRFYALLQGKPVDN